MTRRHRPSQNFHGFLSQWCTTLLSPSGGNVLLLWQNFRDAFPRHAHLPAHQGQKEGLSFWLSKRPQCVFTGTHKADEKIFTPLNDLMFTISFPLKGEIYKIPLGELFLNYFARPKCWLNYWTMKRSDTTGDDQGSKAGKYNHSLFTLKNWSKNKESLT